MEASQPLPLLQVVLSVLMLIIGALPVWSMGVSGDSGEDFKFLHTGDVWFIEPSSTCLPPVMYLVIMEEWNWWAMDWYSRSAAFKVRVILIRVTGSPGQGTDTSGNMGWWPHPICDHVCGLLSLFREDIAHTQVDLLGSFQSHNLSTEVVT